MEYETVSGFELRALEFKPETWNSKPYFWVFVQALNITVINIC